MGAIFWLEPITTKDVDVFVTLPTARRLFKLGDQATAITIVLADDADQESVMAAAMGQAPQPSPGSVQ